MAAISPPSCLQVGWGAQRQRSDLGTDRGEDGRGEVEMWRQFDLRMQRHENLSSI